MEVLKIEEISKHFGGVVAVEGFSMTQMDREISGIIGPNGAGKTTVFNLITGVYPPDTGRIHCMGRDITGLAAHRITETGISRTFQNIRLFSNLSVLDNVKVAFSRKIKYTLWEEMIRLPRVRREEKNIDEMARSYLEYFGLLSVADQKPGNLPYGIQRRLELARALMAEPSLLLLDEPAAGLNPKEVNSLIGMIRKIQEDKGLSIVIVEHHMELIMNICSLIHVLDFGKKIAEGKPEDIKRNELVLQAYLGDTG
ncbi:MAG TPA: ABC transporter ATP-binding protein [Spirochaetia bacterium]|nr:ABC transporter ATP-binding protein [Spirochaetia bacterium]